MAFQSFSMTPNAWAKMNVLTAVSTGIIGLVLLLSGCSAAQENTTPPDETSNNVVAQTTSFDPHDQVVIVYQYADNDWMHKFCNGSTLIYTYVLGTTGGAMKTDKSSECIDVALSSDDNPLGGMVVIYENPGDWMRKVCDGTTLIYSYWLSNTGGAMKTENSYECVG